MDKKVFIKTLGCQMNVYDSDVMGDVLSRLGYSSALTVSSADIIIINTCSVRQHAEDKAWSHIGELKKLKKKKPAVIIAVAGCMAERLGERRIKNKFPYVDLVIGAKRFKDFGAEFDKILKDRKLVSSQVRGKGKQKAFVSIMRGCNNYCSYCVVPYVRGEPSSRGMSDIISSVSALASGGCKQITLLGQNVNAYGNDISSHPKFADLLEEVNKVDGIERIRFMTSHPKDMTSDIIFAVRELGKVCEHIHLPVQSGSDVILEKMNRGYDRKKYISLISGIKKEIPGVSITTDVIVGFPGESDKDFSDTLSLVREIGFDASFIFKYSPRPGTVAEGLIDDIPVSVKKERLAELGRLQEEINSKKNAAMVGEVIEVLVEGYCRDNLSGRTRTNKVIVFEGDKSLVGKLVNVKITSSDVWCLKGEITDKIGCFFN